MSFKVDKITNKTTPKQKVRIIEKACEEIMTLDKTAIILTDSQKWFDLETFNKEGREMGIEHICKRRNLDVNYIKEIMSIKAKEPPKEDPETDAMKMALSSNRISRQSEKRMAYAKKKKEREAPRWR